MSKSNGYRRSAHYKQKHLTRRTKKNRTQSVEPAADRREEPIRIIGGSLRRRQLEYSGELRTRPMKERVRESVFNLIGSDAVGKYAVDLFAGTGALGLEAISRGAASAVFVEQHFPTADLIRQNVRSLGIEDRSEVVAANTFIWARQHPQPANAPWLVFCSPPYAFYVERKEEMLRMLADLINRSPAGSIFVVESDTGFTPGDLLESSEWDVRQYPPAQIAIHRKPM